MITFPRRQATAGSLFVLCLMLFAAAAPAHAETTPDDVPIVNADFLEQYAATGRFRRGAPGGFAVTPDGAAVYFTRSGPRDNQRALYMIDVATGDESLVLTAADLLAGQEETLTDEEKARRERMRLSARGVAGFALSKDGRRLLVPLSGRLFIVDRPDHTVRELVSEHGPAATPRFSPDGEHVACVRNGDVYVIRISDGVETRLTFDAGDDVANGLAEFVAQEEMGRRMGFWWSPDSTHLAYQRTDESGLEQMFIMDPSRPEKAPRGWRYPRPGKVNAIVTLGVVPISGGETTWIDWPREAYPYLATVKWATGAPLTILVQNRHQTEQVLFAVDHHTGARRTLLTETDDAWLNLDQTFPKWIRDGEAFLWASEREGRWRIEERRRDGVFVRMLTPAAFVFKSLTHVADDMLIVRGAGDDPTVTHLYRIDLASGAMTALTRAPGLHGAAFGEDSDVHVRITTPRDGATEWTVRDTDSGEVRAVIASKQEHPDFVPRVDWRIVTGASGRDYHAAVIRPRDFTTDLSYPVIVNVYGGPGGQMVTKSSSRYRLAQWFADQGYIVAIIDGRGTPNRGRAWERSIRGDFIEFPLEDQAEALQALGAAIPQMDLNRVGVYGWSFGGYFSAMAVMRRPDVYHAGVAGAPVCDWLYYDTHYTERFMGLPEENPEGYEASNVLTWAADLERPLMIIHGTADDNVYFAHALQMSDALFRAGKAHEFIPLAGFTHMVSEPAVTRRMYERMVRFFHEHVKLRETP